MTKHNGEGVFAFFFQKVRYNKNNYAIEVNFMTLSLPVIFMIVVLLFLVGGAVAFTAFQKDAKKQQAQAKGEQRRE